ncbi:hypothetical protein R1sor_017715 [Riccia sorocarpa]|uniref:Uncharacterized protein n=1 Tax=Riccia sorocarpa TaxID=122646 RepID=A0ABD3I7P9_9MARC
MQSHLVKQLSCREAWEAVVTHWNSISAGCTRVKFLSSWLIPGSWNACEKLASASRPAVEICSFPEALKQNLYRTKKEKDDEEQAEAEEDEENVDVEEETDKEPKEESPQEEGCFKSYICKQQIHYYFAMVKLDPPISEVVRDRNQDHIIRTRLFMSRLNQPKLQAPVPSNIPKLPRMSKAKLVNKVCC